MRNKVEKNKKIIGLDIIRVIAVISVLCVHFFLNTKYYQTSINGIGMKLQYIVRNIFMICVPLFIILTGYLNKKKEYNKEFFKGLIEVLIIWLFYSIIEFFVSNINNVITIKDFIFQITDFKASYYSWYIEMYIGLYLLSPIINNGYDNLKEKDKKTALILFLIIFILPGIVNELLIDVVHIPDWWYNVYPLGYYITGKYIKDKKPNYNKIKLIIIFILIQALSFILIGKTRIEFESLNVYISSITIFLLVYNIDIKNKTLTKIIQIISALSLDIYLASGLTDQIVYKIFNNKLALYNIPQSRCVLYAPIVVTTSFILATLYAYIRKKLIKVR